MKICTGCGETKPLDQFHRRPDTRDKRQSWCKECQRVANRAWRAANREKVAAYDRQRRIAHPEHLSAMTCRWRRNNVQRYKAALRDWRERNRELIAEYDRRRARERPEYFVGQAHKRRVVLRSLNLEHEDYAYMAVLRRDPCAYCGGPAGTIDHIEPLKSGGDGGWENLTASCRSCNSSKSTATLLAFLARA